MGHQGAPGAALLEKSPNIGGGQLPPPCPQPDTPLSIIEVFSDVWVAFCKELPKRLDAKALPDKIRLIYIIQVREIPVGDRLTSTITFTNPTNHLVSQIIVLQPNLAFRNPIY